MTTYKPNLQDHQVINVLERSVSYVLQSMSENKPRNISFKKIEKKFGRRSCKWLRNILLICTSHNFSKNKKLSKEYIRNRCGIEYIKHLIETRSDNISWKQWQNSWYHIEDESINVPSEEINDIIPVVKKSFDPTKHFLIDRRYVLKELMKVHGRAMLSGDFSYSQKSFRWWNELQSVKKEYKLPFLAMHHYNHMYDIEACAPTLIYQYAKSIKHNLKPTPAYDRYLNNKTEVRQELADLIESDIKDIKVLINALFCGAKLGRNNIFALYQLFYNPDDSYYADAAIIVLKESEYMNQLIEDIKYIWKIIKQVIYPKTLYKEIIHKDTGEIETKRINFGSKQKWDLYFQLENMVGLSIKEYLNNLDCNYFFEHDGWSSSVMININELSEHVYSTTGYKLKYDYEYIEYNQFYHQNNIEDSQRSNYVLPCSSNHSDAIASSDSSDHNFSFFISSSLPDNNHNEITTTNTTYTFVYTPPDNTGLERVTSCVTSSTKSLTELSIHDKIEHKRKMDRERQQRKRLRDRGII